MLEDGASQGGSLARCILDHAALDYSMDTTACPAFIEQPNPSLSL